jgi:hypothetical protein
MVQEPVRTREHDRDVVKQRVLEQRVDTIGKFDRAERRQDADIDPETAERCPNSGPGRNGARY